MKRILALLAALPLLAFAQTKTPVQLLNPAGSTAGQAVVSTGPTTSPGWATVTAGGLTPITGNSVYANFTGSSASPIANAVPSCSTANSALKYTTSTGLSCGTTFALTSGNLSQFASTTSAQLATLLSDETGTGVAVFGTSPTITTPNIVGTATNNNATAGSVGEFVTNSASGVALTNGATANITSISLTAGDWTVWGNIEFATSGATPTILISGVTTTSAGFVNTPLRGVLQGSIIGSNSVQAPQQRLSLSATTTVYIVGTATYTGGTMSGSGAIYARRER